MTSEARPTAPQPTEPGGTQPAVREQLRSDRRDLDAAVFGGGVTTESLHASLRSSVRRLSTLLGESLASHEGVELLALVERVRHLARQPR